MKFIFICTKNVVQISVLQECSEQWGPLATGATQIHRNSFDLERQQHCKQQSKTLQLPFMSETSEQFFLEGLYTHTHSYLQPRGALLHKSKSVQPLTRSAHSRAVCTLPAVPQGKNVAKTCSGDNTSQAAHSTGKNVAC